MVQKYNSGQIIALMENGLDVVTSKSMTIDEIEEVRNDIQEAYPSGTLTIDEAMKFSETHDVQVVKNYFTLK